MKAWLQYLIAVILFGLCVWGIVYAGNQELEEKREYQARIQEDCEVFITHEFFLSDDCYNGEYYHRMQEDNRDGMYCFLNQYGNLVTKCYWDEGLR